MAILHQQFTEFNSEIKLNDLRKQSLKKSRNAIRKKIKKWFLDNKSSELQPKFGGQGSYEMNTTINPIPKEDEEGNSLLYYDLDYGVYFIEEGNEDNRKSIDTWHDWIYESVEDHTNTPPIRKTTCVRVIFSDGHHIDLPIYYKKEDFIELAHRSKGWKESDPKAFFEWFNEKKNLQLERIVRYLKAWKNFRENENSNLKLPSGFELTILATNNYVEKDNDDEAFRETTSAINSELNKLNGFKCERPTKPKEDVFVDYSDTRKTDFLINLKNLVQSCQNAKDELNRKKASEIMQKQFGIRFPQAPDRDDKTQSNNLSKTLGTVLIQPKPFTEY